MNTTLKITIIVAIVVAALAVLGAGFAFAQTPTPWGGYGYGMMGNGPGMMSGDYGMMSGNGGYGMTPAFAPGASVGQFGQSGDGYAWMNSMYEWMTTTGGMHTIVWNGLAEALGLTPDELNAELASGKTLTQIAEAKSVSQEQLAAALEASVKAGLEKAVADGVLTQAQTKQMLNHMSGNYEWMITHTPALAPGASVGNFGESFGPGGCHDNFAPPADS